MIQNGWNGKIHPEEVDHASNSTISRQFNIKHPPFNEKNRQILMTHRISACVSTVDP